MGWYRAQIKDWSEIDEPALAKTAKAHFKADAETWAELLEELADELFYRLLGAVLSDGRKARPVETAPASVFAPTATTKSGKAPAPKTKKRQTKKKHGWELEFENISARVTKRLMDMTKADLLAAAANRGEMARPLITRRTLLVKLAEGMNDTQVVRDRYTPEQIEAIADQIKAVV